MNFVKKEGFNVPLFYREIGSVDLKTIATATLRRTSDHFLLADVITKSFQNWVLFFCS